MQESVELKPVTNQSAKPSRGLLSLGLVLLCFVGGYLGAFVQGKTAQINGPNTVTTLSRERVIAEGEVVKEIATEVSPSVVSVVVTLGGNSPLLGAYSQEGAGTGIIISKDGYILTNKHVVGDTVSKVSVVTNDGTTYNNVKVIGRDPINDIAFLKIDGVNNLNPAKLGDSADLSVGARVVAIGNALGEFQTTVTSGIISGINRSLVAGDQTSSENLSNLIQTDAAINPGNSGGPLVNVNGEVIGINTAISANAEGIGFAIPINEAKGLIKGVLTSGKIERGYLGVRYVMLNDEVAKRYEIQQKVGAYLVGDSSSPAIVSGSPAEKAGLKQGDVITSVNNVKINQSKNLTGQLSPLSPGDTVDLTVVRDGKELSIKVTLERFQ